MIKLEIFEADGTLAATSQWRQAEARQLSAYRMRWLRSDRGRAGLWARTTDATGRVRTYGDVPEGQEAKSGEYGVFEVLADGALSAEPVKTFGTSFARAECYMLDHRLGGNPELAVRWTEDQPQAPGVHEMITVLDAQPDLSDGIDPRIAAVGFDADQVTKAEQFTIAGAPACGAPADGGRCGRRPGHVGHPHIKEPGTEVRGEYYVMPHGFTAPASRPVARFPYVGLEAGDAFDQALAWARKYVKTSFDVWHADGGRSAFIVQVTADGRLLWPRH